jgi:leader peptidase (prepilin peptidase) / N-methyltransferase
LNTEVPVAEVSRTVVAVPAAAVIGLLVGSFLNVVVYRTPQGLSVVAPRSFCPTCRRELEWWENVPVASWIVLRGRCHGCHQPISARYMVVELVTGGAFAFVTWGWHSTAVAIGYCGLAATVVAIACIEYGGIRSPLSVAAVGTGGSEAAVLVAAGLHQHWRIAMGSIVGLVLAVGLFSVLRMLDPTCTDSRAHGRSALLVAGAWLGGLPVVAIVVGTASSVGIYLACLAGARLLESKPPGGDRVGRGGRAAPSVLATPLVTAICVALVVSLVIAR